MTTETEFDPRAFAKTHNLATAALYWYSHAGYEVTAWSPELGDFGCTSGAGKTIAEAISNTEKKIAADRSKPDTERLAHIAKLKQRVAELEALELPNDRNLTRDSELERTVMEETDPNASAQASE